MRYSTNVSCQIEQNGGGVFCTDHAHIRVLETFSPNLQTDPFRWIPKGIFLDLNDNNSPPETAPVNDQVSEYSNQQMFSSIEGDVSSMQAYRNRLLAKYGGAQTTQVNNLFA